MRLLFLPAAVFCCFSLSAQRIDSVVVDNVTSYVSVDRFDTTGAKVVRTPAGRHREHFTVYYATDSTKVHMHGDLKNGMETGHWTGYLPDGRKYYDGNYRIARMRVAPDRDGHVVYDTRMPVRHGTWNEWTNVHDPHPMHFETVYKKGRLCKQYIYNKADDKIEYRKRYRKNPKPSKHGGWQYNDPKVQ